LVFILSPRRSPST